MHKLFLLFGIVSSFLLLDEDSASANGRVNELLSILQKCPTKMSQNSCLEVRRNAVRELGRMKEKRAVPILLNIVNKERFDVILELAIDALGEIGDSRAVAPLKKLSQDQSVDTYVREAINTALKKLLKENNDHDSESTLSKAKPISKIPSGSGHKIISPPQDQPTSTTESTDELEQGKSIPTESTPAASHQPIKTKDGVKPCGSSWLQLNNLRNLPPGPTPDIIFLAERWHIESGIAHFSWDQAAEQTEGSLKFYSRFMKQVEKKNIGMTLDSGLGINARWTDPVAASSYGSVSQGLQVNPEVRYYPFRQDMPLLFGQMSGSAEYQLNYRSQPLFAEERQLTIAGRFSFGIGPGYGRVIDIGPRLRLKRLEQVLKQGRSLTTSISPRVANQLIFAWFRTVNDLGTYQQLGHTIKILEQAKILRSENLNPEIIYRLIRILDDPQLDLRPQGLMLRVGYGLGRNLLKDGEDNTLAFTYATAESDWQMSPVRALEARMRFYYQMLGEPDNYGFAAESAFTQYFYNATDDPLGSLSATLTGGINNQPGVRFEGGGLGYQLLAGGSYTRYYTRGTKLIAGVKAGLDTNAGIILFTLEAEYGLRYAAFCM